MTVSTRQAVRAGSFYPSLPDACRTALNTCLSSAPAPVVSREVVGGIVPHAGWVYSGPTAGLTFRAVGPPTPRTFVLLGAVHVPGVRQIALSPDDEWETPIGPVTVDGELRERIRTEAGVPVESSAAAHRAEHSLEVQVPFVRRLFPGAAILPVAVPPAPVAVEFGFGLGRVLAEIEGRVVVVGSTDLTHYGPDFYGFAPAGVGPTAHRWAKENDRSFLDRLVALDPEGAFEDALARRNACGAGAAAAALAAAKEMGATGAEVLGHVTSHEVRADRPSPTNFVGYASVVFLRDGPARPRGT